MKKSLFSTYTFSSLCVLAASFFLFLLPVDSAVIIPVVFIEWSFIYFLIKLYPRHLQPSLTRYSAVVFLLAQLVALFTVRQNMAEFGSPHSSSDDYYYMEWALDVADQLSSGFDSLKDLWDPYTRDWTLVGWPIFLGTVLSFLPSDNPHPYTLALTINSTLIALVFLSLTKVVEPRSEVDSRRWFWCFLALLPDVLVFGGESRKDTFLLFGIVVTFLSLQMLLQGQPILKWALTLMLGTVIIVLSRVVYLSFLVVMIAVSVASKRGAWTRQSRNRVFQLLAFVIGIGVLVYFKELTSLRIRESEIADFFQSSTEQFQFEGGVSRWILNIPFLGQLLYYLLSPFPMNPFNPTHWTSLSLIRSCGTLMYCGSVLFILFSVAWKKSYRTLMSVNFAAALFFFLSTVVASSEARYKMPSNVFIALTLYSLLSLPKQQVKKRLVIGT